MSASGDALKWATLRRRADDHQCAAAKPDGSQCSRRAIRWVGGVGAVPLCGMHLRAHHVDARYRPRVETKEAGDG